MHRPQRLTLSSLVALAVIFGSLDHSGYPSLSFGGDPAKAAAGGGGGGNGGGNGDGNGNGNGGGNGNGSTANPGATSQPPSQATNTSRSSGGGSVVVKMKAYRAAVLENDLEAAASALASVKTEITASEIEQINEILGLNSETTSLSTGDIYRGVREVANAQN
jgi:hypothetical protein